jgi:hypothetical protein
LFGPKKDEVSEQFRIVQNEELSYLYRPLSVVRIVKSRRLCWSWHVARIGETRNAYRILVGKHLKKMATWKNEKEMVE